MCSGHGKGRSAEAPRASPRICRARKLPTGPISGSTTRQRRARLSRAQCAPIGIKADSSQPKGDLAISLDEALEASMICFEGRLLRKPRRKWLSEEFSHWMARRAFCLCDATTALSAWREGPTSGIRRRDTGPKPAGHGAYSPARYDQRTYRPQPWTRSAEPTHPSHGGDGRAFTGVLYARVDDGRERPKAIEYNARFAIRNDQVLIMRLKGAVCRCSKARQGQAWRGLGDWRYERR